MTGTIAESKFSQVAFDDFLASRDEPSWLIEMRRQAWDTFCQMQWPARNAEQWSRTDIRLFNLDQYSLPTVAIAKPESSLAEGLLSAGVELGGSIASFDSVPVRSQLNAELAEKGVLFGSLDSLVGEHGELVRQHLMTRAVATDTDRFSALHAACWSGGQFLYVPRGVSVEQPLHALSAMSDGGSDFAHTLVILEEGAEATLLTETVSTSDTAAGLHCGAIELILAPGARLRYVNLQNWGTGVWHFAHQKAVIDRESSLQWTIGALGSRLSKVNQEVALVGPDAECQVNGAMFTEGKQHLSYHTLQHHQAPHCRSDFLYKTALQDQSRTVWRGMIKVDQIAQQTNGYQRNDNLLLSNTARADSIPGLEIEADDVRCTHGSTSGTVDEEQVFYCQARGLTRNESIRMIVTGFFQHIFDRISIESVRDALGEAIAQRVRDYE